MRLCIRSHDTGAVSPEDLLGRLDGAGLDGVQLVCYKTFGDVKYAPGAIGRKRAGEIGAALAAKSVALIGAYFNPVHSNAVKVEDCKRIFCDYIDVADALNGRIVGSETGSYNDDKWTYNPLNRTEKARNAVTEAFTGLCAYAAGKNITVGIEGAAGHVCYSVQALKGVLSDIPFENTAVIFDLFNFLEPDSADGYMRILHEGIAEFGGKIKVFHLKDCVRADGKLIQCPPGRGMFDYHAILKTVKVDYPDAALVLEGTTGKDIEPAARYIKEIWNEV